MEGMPQIKLPLGECLRRSFLYVFANFDSFFKIASVWFFILVYEAIFGFPSLCGLKEGSCPSEGYQNLSVVMVSLASIAVAVGFSRQVVLKEHSRYFRFSFGRREIKYLAYSLILFLLIVVPSVVGIGILASILRIIGIQGGITTIIMVIVPLIVATICSRFFIIFPAIAVEDKELDMKKSFELTKGNANKIFWGQAVMMLPVVVIVTLLSSFYEVMELGGFIGDFIFATLLLGLSFLDSALKSSYYSHVYQYFVYFWHHPQSLSEE